MDTIIVKTGKKYSFLKLDDINWIESDKGYLKIHLDDQYYVVAMTLQALNNKLDPNHFKRINRSMILNILKIKEMIDSEKSSDYKVVLQDSTILKWARQYRKNFPDLLLIK